MHTVVYPGIFFVGGQVMPGLFLGAGGHQIQLRTEGREKGVLGAVAP
jgi:hypothetical protein